MPLWWGPSTHIATIPVMPSGEGNAMPPGQAGDPRFGERMTDLEALMWGLEKADPSLQTVMVMAGVLDRPVDPTVMLSRLKTTCSTVARLTESPVQSSLPTVPPRWVMDPEFDVANHFRVDNASGLAGFDALSRIVERSMSEPFEAGRPPWDFTLVDGVAGGRAGFVARLHHSYTDGQGAVRIAMGLFDPPDGSAAGEPGGEEGESSPAPGRAGARDPAFAAPEDVLADVLHELAAGVSAIRRLKPWAAAVIREAVDNPAHVVARAADLANSLARTAMDATLPGSPALADRSGETRVSSLRMSLDDLRVAGKNCGATVNDVFLAGALGGLSLYHQQLGSPFPAIKLGIPISTRGAGESLHNQLQGMLVRAPLDVADPNERIRVVHSLVAEARRQPWLPLVDVAAAAVVRTPFAPNALAGLVRFTEVLVSNLPGPAERLYLGGSRVELLVPFGPRAGSALNLTLLSYAGEVAIGVNADSAAISDPDMLVSCLGRGFDEVLA